MSQFFSDASGDLAHFIAANSRFQLSEIKNIIANLINGNIESYELEMTDNSGAQRVYQIQSSERTWRGKLDGYTFLLSDMSEIKVKEAELAELNQSKDRIFSMIAHDLRKPALAFRGISNKVNYLIQKKDFDSLDNLGNSIEKSAIQLNYLLDNLLKWALSQKNSITIKNEAFNLKQLTVELNESFELIASEKGITIDLSGVDPDLLMENDRDVLHTILRNLLDNAIKYSQTDSSVSINTQLNRDRVTISVADSGVGMPPDQLNNLSAIKVEDSTYGTHGERGSGLGLSLVYDLVQRTQGEIVINSELGQGTEIKLVYQRTPKS